MAKHWLELILAAFIGLQPAVLAAGPVPQAQDPVQISTQDAASAAADYVCPERLQLRYPELCPDVGPAAELEQLARIGLYPVKPLPTVEPVYGPPYLDSIFLRMTQTGTPVYPDVASAWAAGPTSTMSARGFVFYSYFNTYTGPSGEIAYRTELGYVNDVHVDLATIAGRRGLEFTRTPDRPFGWVVSGGSCSQTGPGNGIYTGNCYVLHRVVQIYDSEQVGEWTWYQIGPDEWMEQRKLSVVFPDGTPPEGVDSDRWVVVNLFEQHVTAYLNGELVYATVASTGLPGKWTRPGLHQVWARLDADDMTGGEITPEGGNYYFLDNVPYVMYFDGARALHGTYWHNSFGTQTSRGCVNLSKADANWFYQFTSIGTYIYVWDPSGNTPTDPSLYGEGGA